MQTHVLVKIKKKKIIDNCTTSIFRKHRVRPMKEIRICLLLFRKHKVRPMKQFILHTHFQGKKIPGVLSFLGPDKLPKNGKH